jgi:hypothetical protein
MAITIKNADLSAVQNAIQAVPPAQIQAEITPAGFMVNPGWSFQRLSDVAYIDVGGTLALMATYKGWLEAKAGPGGLADCKLDPLGLDLIVATKPQLTHDGENWFLATTDPKLSLSREAGSDTGCGPFGLYDVGGLIDQRLSDLAGKYQQTINDKKYPIPIANLSSRLGGPILISKRFCLYPRITAVSFGSLSGDLVSDVIPQVNNTLYFTHDGLKSVTVPLLAAAAPSLLVTRSDCPKADPAPGIVQISPFPVAEPFRILASAGIDYPDLSDLAAKRIGPLESNWGPFHLKFSVKKVQVGNSSGQLFVQVDFEGALAGTVYFWGTPTLSPDGNVISVPGIHLAAESQTALGKVNVRLPDFVANLLSGPLQQALVFDISEQLKELKASGSQTITIDGGVTLELGSFSVHAASVRSIPSELQADVVLEGTAAVDLKPSGAP